MARKNKGNKKRKPELKTSFVKKINYKKVLPVVVVFFIILAAYLFLKNSSYFKIQEIKIVDIYNVSGIKSSDFLRIYKGRNIFDVNIRSLSSRIKDDYPFIRNAAVKRVLPNVLEIDIVSRIPIAKVKIGKFYPIDETGMVLSQDALSHDLLAITGLSRWIRPRAGTRIKDKKLANVILLLDALKQSSILRTYNVTKVNAKETRTISFYLDSAIEVKIGEDDFAKRLKVLKSTLSKPGLDKKNIKYIDLRFKDVVIGPR